LISLSINQFLTLFLWFPLAALLSFLLLIARFYQKFSGERTYFRLFLVPVVLFGGAAVRYASIDQVIGDPLGDILQAVAGVVLIALCLKLYQLMIVQQKNR
jgi:hypothetical protein